MITNIEETLDEMKLILEWSNSTYTLYKIAVQSYSDYHKQPFESLIKEAEKEETSINKVNKRNIKKRLIQYRLYLQKTASQNTVKTYVSKIIKIYKYLDIETPDMPPFKIQNKETFEDIPKKSDIKKAILNSRLKMKAIISFIASSGLRVSDVSNLTINDFLQATNDYHDNNNNLFEILQQLTNNEFIIPTWRIQSKKTKINHITFSSDESTRLIIDMLKDLLMKKEVTLNDKLFRVQSQTITHNFNTVNKNLNYGWKETRRFFHPHSLRKYFATTLISNDISYLDAQFLLGHSLSKVDSSYYYANAEKLKNKYIFVVKHLTFMQDIDYIKLSDADKKELEELKQFKLESMQKINQLEEMINFLSNTS